MGSELNKSISWLKKHPDADPTAYALEHPDYYRGFYDANAKFLNYITLEPGEIFNNGEIGHFLVIGAGDPFWCIGMSEEAIRKRIHEKNYPDCLFDIYRKKTLTPELSELGIGLVDPNKVVYFDVSKKTKKKLGAKGNLLCFAPRIFSEKSIEEMRKNIVSIIGDWINPIFDIKYPQTDFARISRFCNMVDEINRIGLTMLDVIYGEKQYAKKSTDCSIDDSNHHNRDMKVDLVTDIAPDYAVKAADDISDDIEKTKKRFAPSITETAIALANKGIVAKRQERYEDAIQYYKAVIQLLPENGAIYYNLGKLFYIIGDFDKSRKAYTLAYIFGAPNDDGNLFRHLGHAIKDESHTDDAFVKTYRDTIRGKKSISMNYMPTPEMNNDYISIGRSQIDSLKHDYESWF